MNDFLQSLRNGQAEKQRTPKTRKNFDNGYHYTSSPRFHSYGGYQNNRNQHMKRPHTPNQGNQLPVDENSTTSMLAEAIESLSGHIETLAKNQDYLVSVQERTADMLERQAVAIERIVDHLNIAPEKKPGQTSDQTSDQKIEPEKKSDPISVSKKPLENHYVTSKKAEAKITEPVETIKTAKTIVRKRKKVVAKKNSQATSKDQKLLSRETVMDIINTMRAEGKTFDQVANRLVELGQPTFSGRGEWHAQTIHRLCNKK
ncbi:MAG: hypothetical protein GY699_20175 [Desulfobacteraceae bacterium]|nr:hypothetical protein [Desulfobacteraceae bacterium]